MEYEKKIRAIEQLILRKKMLNDKIKKLNGKLRQAYVAMYMAETGIKIGSKVKHLEDSIYTIWNIEVPDGSVNHQFIQVSLIDENGKRFWTTTEYLELVK